MRPPLSVAVALSVWALGMMQFAAGTACADGDVEGVPVTRIVANAVPEPVPALQYRLLPPLLDVKPGNAAIVYAKAAVALEYRRSEDERTDLDKISDWLDVPVEKLPRDEVEKTLGNFASTLAELDRAARMETCDWQLDVRREQPWLLLLPEVQGMRSLGRIVALKARLQIAAGEFDDALRTLQTGFAMARHVAEGPTLINGLVGIAIANILFGEIDAWIQAPQAPNLYWALMALPRPLIDLRRGVEVEENFVNFAFPRLTELDSASYSAEDWRQQLVNVSAVCTELLNNRERAAALPPEIAATQMALRYYPPAKAQLIASGRSAAEVEALPVPQVVLWGINARFREIRDDLFKWWYVPLWQQGGGPARAEELARGAERRADGSPFVGLVGNAQMFAVVQARCNRLVAAHVAVEALRGYAAGHDGKLPATLALLTATPALDDPTLGRPFEYQLNGATAVLTSPPPLGTPGDINALQFELAIRP